MSDEQVERIVNAILFSLVALIFTMISIVVFIYHHPQTSTMEMKFGGIAVQMETNSAPAPAVSGHFPANL